MLSRWFQARQYQPELTSEVEAALCQALHVPNIAAAQDVINALLLSECVYKVADQSAEEVLSNLKAFQQQFPPQFVSLQGIQCTLPHVPHRYLVAASPKVLYASFIGTKQAKDVLVDANLLHSTIWQVPETALKVSPSAHAGFLARARGIPAEELIGHAIATNRRLVLCGHSLGGAVAVLCTLHLLQQLSDQGREQGIVQCISFGTPAIGNAALARKVEEHGWKDLFHNITLPEDLVPRLLAFNPAASQARTASGETAEPTTSSDDNTGGGMDGQPARTWSRWVPAALPSKLTSFRLPSAAWRSTAVQGSRPDEDPSLQSDFAEAVEDGLNGEATAQHERQRLEEEASLRERDALVGIAKPALASRMSGAVSSVARRIPGWRAAAQEQGSADSRLGPGAESQAEEGDDAVDALVEGPASGEGPSAAGPGQEGRSWLQRLAQLQVLATSAASGVLNAGQLLPSFVHFGRSVTWQAPLGSSPPATGSFTSSNLRSRLLASHRMNAYRNRAAALCASVATLADHPAAPAAATELSDSVLPKLVVSSASARLEPLKPQWPTTAEQRGWGRRWSRDALTGSAPRNQADAVRLQVAVDGDGLAFVRGARLQVADGSKRPVRILGLQGHSESRFQNQPGMAWKGPFQWLRERLQGLPAKPKLVVEATIPATAALQVYEGAAHASRQSLAVQLRSDFVEARTHVSMHLPRVWLLAQTPAAADSLMSTLVNQSRPLAADLSSSNLPLGKPGPLGNPKGLQEAIVDGVRWHNLLATRDRPLRALQDMTQALLSMQPARRGLARLQMWLPTASVVLLDPAARHAIVIAAEIPRRQAGQVRRLMVAAKASGVPVVIAPLGGSGTDKHALESGSVGQQVQQRPADGGKLDGQDWMALRWEVHRVLSGDTSQPRSKL